MLAAFTGIAVLLLSQYESLLISNHNTLLAMGIAANVYRKYHNSHTPIVLNLRLAAFILSLVTNIMCTGLISFRLLRTARRMGAAFGGRPVSRYYKVLVVIIESAAIYTVSTAFTLAFYAGNTGVGKLLSFVTPQILVSLFAHRWV